MKQIVNNLSDGSIVVVDAPSPKCLPNGVLIASNISLVSSGTEKMLIDFGKSNYLSKALNNPDRVKQAFDKIRTDGIVSTYETISAKLAEPIPLGYCNSGIVIKSNCPEFNEGDRVVSNGPHAEIVSAPKHLIAKIPTNLEDEKAVFTVLGSIALHGIRLSNPTMGETFFVMGLGLVGLLAVQLLKAHGCKVICSDINQKRIAIAEEYGAIGIYQDGLEPAELNSRINDQTNGLGVDSVIIATSTSSNDPIDIATMICRKRGRIVLVGTSGLSINRASFYEKEISFQVSCSYGPGRYDVSYEKNGIDYPYPYVRWTEQRNFQAVLDLMDEGKIDTKQLISHRYNIADGEKAFQTLYDKNYSLGIILKYPGSNKVPIYEMVKTSTRTEDSISLGWIGAGNYANKTLIPTFKKNACNLEIITTNSGITAANNAKKFGFTYATNDLEAIFNNEHINTIIITTTHESHSSYIISALKANKHVFCEKPLCISMHQLHEIKEIKQQKPELNLMIGFNRRFAPLITTLKEELGQHNSPMTIIMTINAGFIDSSHWIHDPKVGGGRLIGEACHFIDLAIFLTNNNIVDYTIIRTEPTSSTDPIDNFIITLKFENGSMCQINYLTRGSKLFPKERIEVFSEGKIFQINNFLNMVTWKGNFKRRKNKWRQDKGQKMMIKNFVTSIRNSNKQIIDFEEICHTAEVAISLDNILRK